VDELLPLLVAHLLSRSELTAALEAAIEGTLAFLPLEEAPSADGVHALEIDVPWWTRPVVVLAEPAGLPSGGLYPLALRTLSDESAGDLLALLAAESEVAKERVDVDADVEAEAAPASRSMAVVGQILGGKYEVGALLGAGGMGNVFHAQHLALDKAIAVKVLHPRYQNDPGFVASFHREARASSRLDHPNVVRVLDFGQEPDGRLYLTMELLAGSDLRAVLNVQRRLTLPRIIDVMSQVCAALSASHGEGVVHRDIKPDNIRLVPSIDDEGKPFELVKVCDFGIAEILGSERAESSTTTSGTPDYMSPEQAQGAALDARSDIYSCGIMLYELATGVVPFVDGQTPLAILRMQIESEPRAPSTIVPGLDRRLEAVILKAMRKDPAERYQSARELRVSLRAIAETAPAQPRAKVRSVRLPASAIAQRADAIDIDDLLAGGDAWRGDAQPEQAWIEGEQYATALIKDPEIAAARLDAITDPAQLARELPGLDRAMAALAHRGEAVALQAVVARLAARARGEAPGDATGAGLAAKALQTLFAKPTLLLPIAQAALDAPAPARESARRVLAVAGVSGAVALCTARQSPAAEGELGAGMRSRFVAALREVGLAALPVIVDALRRAAAHEAALLEDLLRAVPESVPAGVGVGDVAGDPGDTVAEQLRHATPAVRRAAVTALASLWGPRARPRLVKALDDADESVLMAAIGALHRGGGIDGDLVRRIERILAEASPASDELRMAAAGALVDTVGPARAQAIEVVSRAVAPPVAGFLSKLMSAEAVERPQVVVALARVLIGLAGEGAARVIETRAARSSAELKRDLLALTASR
jgi:serine/threonine-protein kinase